MTELRLCPACRRHVATRERACPFCSTVLAPARGQYIALAGRVSRAAVFSAALSACTSDKPREPVPGPAQGSDDLEQLLDTDERVVPHADPAPPADAAIADAAAPIDAGAPVDAGIARKKRKKKKVQEVEVDKTYDRIIHAKPYGAPPARRRIV